MVRSPELPPKPVTIREGLVGKKAMDACPAMSKMLFEFFNL